MIEQINEVLAILPFLAAALPSITGGAAAGGTGIMSSILGQGLPILGNLLGGLQNNREFQQLQSDMQASAAFGDQRINAGGITGSIGADFSNLGFNQQGQGIQNLLAAQGGLGMMGGNLGFDASSLSNVLGGTDIGALLGNVGQGQIGSSAFGGLGGLAGQAGGLANMFAQQTAAGPQDLTGGAMGQLFQGGLGNLAAAGNQDALAANRTGLLRQQATQGGLLDQAINRLQNRQFATGRSGTTGGAQETGQFLDALARQDLGFQMAGQDLGAQQQQLLGNLGLGQLGQAGGFLGQNLGQFNTGAGLANQFMGAAGGFEGQQFGQNLQSLMANRQGGMDQFNAFSQLLGQGGGLFQGGQQMGLASLGLLSDRDAQLQNFLVGLRNSEAARIEAAGTTNAALAGMGTSGSGGLISGVLGGLGGLFGG